jgi:hypothetical protein
MKFSEVALYEPTTISLCTPTPLIITPLNMEPSTPPNPMSEHRLGYEILAKRIVFKYNQAYITCYGLALARAALLPIRLG